jgi:hypothetical protein
MTNKDKGTLPSPNPKLDRVVDALLDKAELGFMPDEDAIKIATMAINWEKAKAGIINKGGHFDPDFLSGDD